MNKEAVAELLAYQVPPSQIAAAFGVSSQYIANMVREDETLQDMLREKAEAIAVREHDNKVNLEVITHDLLSKIQEQITMSDSLMESTKALQIVQDIVAKMRAISHGSSQEGPKAGTIELNIAPGAEVQIQTNGQSEIINIAGRDMAPMPAHRVLQAVKEKRDAASGESTPVGTAPADARSYSVPATDSL